MDDYLDVEVDEIPNHPLIGRKLNILGSDSMITVESAYRGDYGDVYLYGHVSPPLHDINYAQVPVEMTEMIH